MRSIIYFIKKEFLQFKRDPKMFGMILIAPVLQLVFLGLAANLDVDNVKTIVYDMDRSYTSRDFIEKFTSSGYFQIIEYANNYDEVTEALDNAEVILAIVIPPGTSFAIGLTPPSGNTSVKAVVGVTLIKQT